MLLLELFKLFNLDKKLPTSICFINFSAIIEIEIAIIVCRKIRYNSWLFSQTVIIQTLKISCQA